MSAEVQPASVRGGKSYAPTFACVRIGEAVDKLGEEFSHQEVLSQLASVVPHISNSLVAATLYHKVKQGVLVKLEACRYRKVPHATFVQKLPNGVIADALWNVLLEHRAHATKKEDLVVETERRVAKAMNKKFIRLPTQVHTLLVCWAKYGSLRHFDSWGENSYQILPGITERPPVKI